MRNIYFDNASTTKVDKRVILKIVKYLEKYINVSNKTLKHNLIKKIKNFKKKIALILNCKKKEIIFTSGATESNNLAIKGFCSNNKYIKRLLTLKTEHKSVLNSFKRVKKYGHKVYFLNVKKNGLLNFNKLKKVVYKKKICFISIMWVNNEIGVIQNIKKISEFCNKKNIIIHVDASQAFGKINIDLKKIKIDLLSISAHKNHGPKGVGILFKRNNIFIKPELEGGGQQKNMRSGTIPTHQIAGLYETFRISNIDFKKNNKKISKIFNFLLKKINKIKGIRINGSLKKRIKNNLNISLEGINGKTLIKKMGNVFLSIGSACNSGKQKPSHVLKSIKVPGSLIPNSLRITISKYNTIKEAKILIKLLNKNYSKREKILF